MADIIKNIDKTVSQAMSDVTQPTVVRGLIHLLLALYAVRLAPELPKGILDLFTNQYFRLFIFTLILWTAKFSPTTAIMISLAFMVSVNAATNKPLWEFLDNVVAETPKVEENKETVPPTDVAPTPAPISEQAPVPETPPAEAVDAVKKLAEAAAAPTAAPPQEVIVNAEKAMDAVKTSEGAAAVSQLAEQAMDEKPAEVTGVVATAEKAVVDMVKEPAPSQPAAPVQEPGCFPIRPYDMSKVTGFDPMGF